MKLILTRHAKSAWDDPLMDDFDRPLNDRGLRSAALIGKWLAAEGHVPGEVFVSGATRTVETWAGISAALPEAILHEDRKLYLGSSDRMLSALYRAKAETVMMIAHNPGIAEFAKRIVTRELEHTRLWDYPTCATLVMRFDIASWRDARFGIATPLDFVIPRELEGDGPEV